MSVDFKMKDIQEKYCLFDTHGKGWLITRDLLLQGINCINTVA